MRSAWLRPSSFLPLLVLLATAPHALAQPLEEDFSAGVPAGPEWASSPDAMVAEPEAGGAQAALALPSTGSFLQVAVTNPDAVTFWRAPSRPGDDYALALLAECGGERRRHAYRHAPGDLPSTAFTPEIVSLRHPGPCTLRWEVEAWAAGTPMIDRIRVERLTGADSLRLATEREVRRMLTAELTATNTAAAAARLDPIVQTAETSAQQLANLAGRIYSVEALAATGAALSTGAALANPLEYPEFQRTTGTLQPFMTGPGLVQLETTTAALRSGFQTVREARGQNALVALASMALGAAIGDYRGALLTSLTVLSSGGRPVMARLADALGIRRRGRWEAEVQNRLAATSGDAHAFLTGMMTHAERTQERAARAQEIAGSARRLAAEADTVAAALLREAGVGSERLGVFRSAAMKRADGRALTEEERQVLEAYARGLRAARDRAVVGGMDPTLNLAERLRTVLLGAERLHAGYGPLIASQRQYYDEEVAYYCGARPPVVGALVAAETQRVWTANARAAVEAFTSARDAFYRAYTPAEAPPVLDRAACAVMRG